MKVFKAYIKTSKQNPLLPIDWTLFNEQTLLPEKMKNLRKIIFNNLRNPEPTNIISKYGEMVDKFGLELKEIGTDKAGTFMILHTPYKNVGPKDFQRYKGINDVYIMDLEEPEILI